MDYLSTSPSLPYILSLLSPYALLRCSRVNRRIQDVFKQHRRTLPRPRAEMGFQFLNHENETLRIKVDLFINRREIWALVYERCIEFYNCDNCKWMPWMLDLYENQYSAFRHHGPLSVVPYGRHLVKAAFETASMKEGLRQLVSCIFERYHCTSIEMKRLGTATPVAWYKLIADLLKRSRSKCEKLETHTCNAKEWNEIINLFDCGTLIVPTTLSRMSLFLPSISTWNRQLIFDIDTALSLATMPRIVDIVQKWKSGSIDIKMLKISPNYDRHYPLGLTMADIERAVSSRKFSVRYDLKYPNAPSIYVLFKRSKDDRILSLVYSQEWNELKLFDHIESKDY